MCINTSNERIEFETSYINLEEYCAEKFNNSNQKNNYSPINNEEIAELIEKKINLKHVNDTDKESVRRLLTEFLDIFYLEGQKSKAVSIVEHEIPTTDNFPIRSKQFRHPPSAKKEGEKLIKEQLMQGVIEHLKSPHNSPVLVLPKKIDLDGSQRWRLVIDYRKLNE